MMKMENIEFKPGTLLAGRYLLQKHLGRGGMGTVWLAKDEELDDLPVATKLLLPELANDSQFVSSLKEEAKSSMKLSHPNIVRVYNLHRDEENSHVTFLVLKYIKGGTMKETLQEWPQGVPLERVLRWGDQLASALDYAHSNGVIHRDIKPSNIMIDVDSDSALLMDFGISRQCDQTLRSGSGASRPGLGTLAYMSPQQLQEKDCASNDIYSLAATLYQALSGRAPFIGDDIEEKILRSQPQPIKNVSDVVNRALLAGLAKVEQDRPETAEDLIDLMRLGQGPQRMAGTTLRATDNSSSSTDALSKAPPTRTAVPLLKLFVAAVLIGGVSMYVMKPELFDFLKNGAESSEVEQLAGAGSTSQGTGAPAGPGGIDSTSPLLGDPGTAHQTPQDLGGPGGDGATSPPPPGGAGVPGQGATDPSGLPVLAQEPDADEPIDLSDSTPALFSLVRRGEPSSFQTELDRAKGDGELAEIFDQVDPNTGYKLIHAAVAAGRIEMVSALLDAGASIETRGSMPRRVTPLHVAIETGRAEIVKLLLDSGANIRARDGGESGVLHLAAKRSRSQRDYDLLLLLIEAGAPKDIPNIHGQVPSDLVPITSEFREAATEALK